MSDYKNYLANQVMMGKMNRREFIGRTVAAGVALSSASTLFASSAAAQEPKRGGHLKLGLEGAAATDSKDPAKALSQFMFVVGRNWGDMLVESDPLTGQPVAALAESWEPSADASTWTFTIRKGVKFHDGKELTVEGRHQDPAASYRRKIGIGRSRRHEIDQGNQGRRRQAGAGADGRQCRPAAAPHRLPSRHPAEWRASTIQTQ